MKGKVIPLGNITRLNIPADQVLVAAIDKLESVIIIGYDKEGQEYFASSIADGGDTLWLVERFKKRLLEIPEEME